MAGPRLEPTFSDLSFSTSTLYSGLFKKKKNRRESKLRNLRKRTKTKKSLPLKTQTRARFSRRVTLRPRSWPESVSAVPRLFPMRHDVCFPCLRDGKGSRSSGQSKSPMCVKAVTGHPTCYYSHYQYN